MEPPLLTSDSFMFLILTRNHNYLPNPDEFFLQCSRKAVVILSSSPMTINSQVTLYLPVSKGKVPLQWNDEGMERGSGFHISGTVNPPCHTTDRDNKNNLVFPDFSLTLSLKIFWFIYAFIRKLNLQLAINVHTLTLQHKPLQESEHLPRPSAELRVSNAD